MSEIELNAKWMRQREQSDVSADPSYYLSGMEEYEVVRQIGRGGAGLVFEVTAPGGFSKAVKIVTLDAANPLSEREVKGLKLIRSIRHPYLLSIDRLDIDQSHITMIMELADHNLREEFEAARSRGLRGIPRAQLLQLLREAAEVLDLLNLKYGIQHLDVKPENLFLVSGHIKVGDFGLVAESEQGRLDEWANAITPSYAAPELFNGNVSRFADQYSLAVVFMEMLTGQRPYAATDVRQLAFEHLKGNLNLSILHEPDRSIVSKALSRNPNDRFESCMALVHALSAGPDVSYVPIETQHEIVLPPEVLADIAELDNREGETLPEANDLAEAMRRTDPVRMQQETIRIDPPERLAMLEQDVTASITRCFVAKMPPTVFLEKLEQSAAEWGAEFFRPAATKVAIRFETKTSFLRSIVGMKESLVAMMRVFQRASEEKRTLVQLTISYHGRKLTDRAFMQYVDNAIELLKRELFSQEVPASKIRQHSRMQVQGTVYIMSDAIGGEQAPVTCSAVDISSRGMGAVSPKPIPVGEIRLRFSGTAQFIRGKIVRCDLRPDNRFHLGIVFPIEPAYPDNILRTAAPIE